MQLDLDTSNEMIINCLERYTPFRSNSVDGFSVGKNTLFHGKSSFAFMVNTKQYIGTCDIRRLEEGSVGFIVINGIHLGHKGIRIFFHILYVVLIGASLQVFPVFPFLYPLAFGFGILRDTWRRRSRTVIPAA